MTGVESYWMFLVAGVGLIAAVIGALMTQGLARSRDERRADKALRSLRDGVGQEYRLNLFEAMEELHRLIEGPDGRADPELQPGSRLHPPRPVELIPVEAPLHTAAMQNLARLDHAAMAVIGFGYRELSRHKAELSEAQARGDLIYAQVQNAVNECVEGLALIYLWRQHYGKKPKHWHAVRKNELLTYAREQGLSHYHFPGVYLFDMLVDYLRRFGLKVTPVPLMMAPGEYYSRPPGDRAKVAELREKARQRREREAQKRLAIANGEAPERGRGVLARLPKLRVPRIIKRDGTPPPSAADSVPDLDA